MCAIELFEINTKQEGFQSSVAFDKKQKERILVHLIVSGDATANELERVLHIRISSITARLNELEREGKVKSAGTRKDQITGIHNKIWKPT